MSRVPRDSMLLKATAGVPDKRRGEPHSAWLLTRGAREEDGPETWESLVSPRTIPAEPRGAGDQFPAHTARPVGAGAMWPRTSAHHEAGRRRGEPQPRPKGTRRRRAAYERRSRITGGPRSRRSKGGPCQER